MRRLMAMVMLAGGIAAQAIAATPGLSLLGAPALPPDFTHFPYVNPDAPKGGTVTRAEVGTFDSFNPFILRGTAPADAHLVWQSLLAADADEPDAAYGDLADGIVLAPDGLGVTFALRAQARFADGTPVTATDVAWTFNTLRAHGRPFYAQYYADVTSVTADDPRHVTFRFRTPNRELPLILGQMPVLPMHWWQGRDFSAPLRTPPLGSGPYRVGAYEFGRSLTLERVRHWWARNLPPDRGLFNFNHRRTEFFRDPTVAFEAFKAGEVDFRQENVSKTWATGYDFPAVRHGWVRKVALAHRLPTGMQGFAMNTRRALFADARVRHALALAFDFEWENRNLFYGLYTRTHSYFSNSIFASSGIPQGAELALLDRYRKALPAGLFTRPFSLPVTDGMGDNRPELRAALRLLGEAGWHVRHMRLENAAGQPFHFTILLPDPAFERVALPYTRWLARLGIQAQVRTVDPAQYQRLMDQYNYDMTIVAIGESDSPGNEQTGYWTCGSAGMQGGDNLMGVCNKVVDALVHRLVAAPDRASLITDVRALDRVLLWNWYVVPQWHLPAVWVAYWDKFGHPRAPVRTGLEFNSWWFDAARAAKLAAARGGG